jgi:hypothetical protein
MVKKSDYGQPEVQACFSVMVEIITILGEYRDNIVLIGEMFRHYLFRRLKKNILDL